MRLQRAESNLIINKDQASYEERLKQRAKTKRERELEALVLELQVKVNNLASRLEDLERMTYHG